MIYLLAFNVHIQQNWLASLEGIAHPLAQFLRFGHFESFDAKRAGKVDEIQFWLNQVHPQIILLRYLW